jgi:hypothetical protein
MEEVRMSPCRVLLVVSSLLSSTVANAAPKTTPDDRIDLRLDTSEATAVLSLVAKHATHQHLGEEDWRRLFTSEPYGRLVKREAEMHRAFSDNEFKAFVLSPDLAHRAPELRRTLDTWAQADLVAAAERALAYLPKRARIRAKVYPVIKPRVNSFVFEPSTDPAIFLALDPQTSAAQFENTLAHELHHIGYASVNDASNWSAEPPRVATALRWLGGFGEGFAMLAAAGSPDVHPDASSPPEVRARWDADIAHLDRDLEAVQAFLLDVLDGRLSTPEDVHKAGFSFYGEQGPWYTVGWKMAVVIEKRYGRPTLIDCMLHPRKLLARYNAAAAELNGRERLPRWSPDLLRKLAASPR